MNQEASAGDRQHKEVNSSQVCPLLSPAVRLLALVTLMAFVIVIVAGYLYWPKLQKEFLKVGETSFPAVETYSTQDFSYQFPEEWVRIDNPRNYDISGNSQYFLPDQELADDYQKCLEKGREQSAAYEQDPTVELDWVDWELSCDARRVLLKVSVTEDELESSGMFQTIVDDQGRRWIKTELFGWADDVALIYSPLNQGHSYAITVASHHWILDQFFEVDGQYKKVLHELALPIVSSFEVSGER